MNWHKTEVHQAKGETRRAFLKYSLAAGSAALVLGPLTSIRAFADEERGVGTSVRMALLMDNSLCVNCHSCRLACQNENNLPVTRTYINFDYLERGAFPNVENVVSRHSCRHCADAPCVNICPVKALSKGGSGFTHTDFEKCIGCGACRMVCPFKIPIIARDPDSGAPKMYKCNACKHLIARGIAPACVSTCITGAMSYGTWDEMLEKAEKRVEQIRPRFPEANVYGRTQQDGLGLLVVLRTPAADYPHLVS